MRYKLNNINIYLLLVFLALPLNASGLDILSGDVAPRGNPDGKLDSADIAVLELFVFGKAIPSFSEKKLSDVAPINLPDGDLNFADVMVLKQQVSGKIISDSFSPYSPSPANITFEKNANSVRIRGKAGLFSENNRIKIINVSVSPPVTLFEGTVNSDGSFSVSISALTGEKISIIAIDESGNESIPTPFTILDDPLLTTGPYQAGWVDIDDPTFLPQTGSDWDPRHLWARLVYPATAFGKETTIDPGISSSPLVVFIHQYTQICDTDGPGAGTTKMSDTDPACVNDKRIPLHEGYMYLMNKLAEYGITSISISRYEILHKYSSRDSAATTAANNALILRTLDKIKEWNSAGNDPFGGFLVNKLDLSKIVLSGHSSGGAIASKAYSANLDRATPHSIVAISLIAPVLSSSESNTFNVPYFGIRGGADSDSAASLEFVFEPFDKIMRNVSSAPNYASVAYVHGANHKFFNTILTSTASSPSPWAGSEVESIDTIFINPGLLAEEQRNITVRALIPFIRMNLQGVSEYRQVLKGEYKFNGAPNDFTFWSYADESRLTIDNSSGTPDISTNSLNGNVTHNGFVSIKEYTDLQASFPGNMGQSIGAPPLLCGGKINHSIGGLVFEMNGASAIYSTQLPIGFRDVSNYNVLSFRIAKYSNLFPFLPYSNNSTNIQLQLTDSMGRTGLINLNSNHYGFIPTPQIYDKESYTSFIRDPFGGPPIVAYQVCNFLTANAIALNTIRIPLSHFEANSTDIDLTRIESISFGTKETGTIVMTDIEFSN